jgi:hypothetical protein
MSKLILAGLLFTGCSAYTSALYGPDSTDGAFTQCHKETFGESMIPDYGITVRKHFAACMKAHGWEQTPGSQYDGYNLGPVAYQRIK